MKKIMSFWLIISLLSGCGMVVRQLDSSWNDNRRVYEKSTTLPPLQVPPELATGATP